MNPGVWMIFTIIGIIGLLLVERYGRHGVTTRRRIAARLATVGFTTLLGAELGRVASEHDVTMLTAVFLGGVVGLIGGIIIAVAGSARAGQKWPNKQSSHQEAV